MDKRTHIEKLCEEKGKNDRNSRTLASTLNKDIATAFKGEQKFVFELLQNADDAADGEAAVSFTLVEEDSAKYLLFNHNGKHFTEQDVEKICDNAQQEYQDKSTDSQKTGYKGIGFKAVFSIADCVYIFSDQYQFRFDKFYDKWKDAPQNTPWQIAPIWTEPTEISKNISKLLDVKKVNFVLKLKSQIDVDRDLEVILQNPTIMLFLRHVNSLNITKTTNGPITFTLKTEALTKKDTIKKTINRNDVFLSAWLLQSMPFAIPAKEQAFLATLEAVECPQRLKDAQQTQITFAVPINLEGKLAIPQQNNLALFCYLPTQVSCGLPFLVNADFLLNAERTMPLNNNWNKFLFLKIAYYHFQFLATLTNFPLVRNQVLHCLSSDSILNVASECQQSFKAGYAQGVAEVAFIPQFEQAELLTCKKAWQDEFEFFKTFGVKTSKGIVDYAVEKQEALRSWTKQLSEEQLCEYITEILNLKSIDTQKKLITFLIKTLQHFPKLIEPVRKTLFLLTDKNQLAKPREDLFLGIAAGIYINPALKVKCLHPDLLRENYIKEWLAQNFGMKVGNGISILRSCLPWDNREDKQTIFAITLLAFQLFKNALLTKEDFSLLRRHSLLTVNNELVETQHAYLPDIYNPVISMQGVVNENFLVSDRYLESPDIKDLNDEAKRKLWCEYFENLGVNNRARLNHYQMYLVGDAQQANVYMLDSYLQTLRSAKVFSGTKHNSGWCFKDIYVFSSNQFHNPRIVAYFWQEVSRRWEHIKVCRPKLRLMTGEPKELSDSYLQHIVKRGRFLKGSKDKHVARSAAELYAPQFGSFANVLNVAEIAVDLTEEQARYFGFKTELTFDDCYNLLQDFDTNEKNVVDDFGLVFKRLLNLHLADEQKRRLRFYEGRLLAEDGSLQPKAKLMCFGLQSNIPLKSKRWLKELPGFSREEMLKLASLFKVTVVAENSNQQINFSSPQVDATFLQRLKDRLPALAYLVAHLLDLDPGAIFVRYTAKIVQLKFLRVKELSLQLNNNVLHPKTFHFADNNFYYDDNWDAVSVCEPLCLQLMKYLDIHPDLFKRVIELLSLRSLNTWCKQNDIDQTLLNKIKDTVVEQPLDNELDQIQDPKNMPTDSVAATDGHVQKDDDTTDKKEVWDLGQSSQTKSKAQVSVETDNLAVRIFLGQDGVQPSASHLDFKTWYHPETCQFLLRLVSNQAKCIRVDFDDECNDNNTETFKIKLQQLIALANVVKRPAVFISKEPGAQNHFICGVINAKKLLLINPLGITDHDNCYQTLAELKAESTIHNVWLSSNQLQRRDYEENLVSCGPIALEMASHILDHFSPEKLDEFWEQLKTNEPTLHEQSGLNYHGVNVGNLLPDNLKALINANDQAIYRNQVCAIRKNHLAKLRELSRVRAKEAGMPIDDYLKKCRDADPIQQVFGELVRGTKSIDEINVLDTFVTIKQALMPAVKQDPAVKEKPKNDEAAPAAGKFKKNKLSDKQKVKAENHEQQEGASAKEKNGLFKEIKLKQYQPKQKAKTKKHNGGAKNPVSDQRKVEIGKQGETYIYEQLKLHYQTKPNYNQCQFAEKDFGFELIGENIQLTVIWHNKNAESYKAKDFTIKKIKADEQTKRLIEVKTTTDKSKRSFEVSTKEFEKLQKHGSRYSFFRVFYIDSDTERGYEVIRNPKQAIADGEMHKEVKTYTLKYQKS